MSKRILTGACKLPFISHMVLNMKMSDPPEVEPLRHNCCFLRYDLLLWKAIVGPYIR